MSNCPTFKEALKFWLKLGLISFGGPAGQIAIMHAELVQRKGWISEKRFLHALNFCMLLPGPEAQQLATYSGWLLHGWRGGLAAGILFILPSAVMLWGLSFVYVTFGEFPGIKALFYGLKPAVAALVIAALVRLGKRTLQSRSSWAVAALAFLALFAAKLPFPLVIFTAGLFGFFAMKNAGTCDADTAPQQSWPRTLRVLSLGLAIWWLPILLAGASFGGVLFQQGLFFSKAAMVTFGGAYAVLPYVAQQAVEKFQWLSAPQMLDGLGLAETTPGPLIMVLQFVGFLGAWHQPGDLSPLCAATLGAAITVWATFVPSFVWIFTLAPHLEQLRGIPSLNGALSAMTAAVVGVVLNLVLWFAWHALFPGGKPDLFGCALALVALVGMVRWRWGIGTVIGASAAAGLLHWLLA